MKFSNENYDDTYQMYSTQTNSSAVVAWVIDGEIDALEAQFIYDGGVLEGTKASPRKRYVIKTRKDGTRYFRMGHCVYDLDGFCIARAYAPKFA